MHTVIGLGQVDTDIVQPVLGSDIRFIENPDPEDFRNASGAIVRGAFRMSKEVFDLMPNLAVVARTGVGTELVDVDEATRRNIPVIITPGSNTNAVAEGVFAHALHLVKRLGPHNEVVKSGRWDDKNNYPVYDLEDSTLGIIGYGRIGKRVAHLAEAFGMRVLAIDPYADIPAEMSAQSMTDLASRCDIITLHVPLTEQTYKMINKEFFDHLKHGSIMVNCGRGALIDLDDATAALASGRLGGLGLDVYEEEPPPHHRIFDHENVVLTPHVMGLSVKATEATYRQAAQGIRAVLEGKPAPHAVNIKE